MASRRQLATIGYDCPDWTSLLEGARPRQPNLDEVDPGVPNPTISGGRCGRASVVRRSPIGHRYHINFVGAGRRQTSPAVCSRGRAALSEARRRKQCTYPELSGTQGRARLVVLAAEVGGRWSDEARAFVSQLAKAEARAVPRVLAGRARQAWQHRWSSMLACAAARAFALSLLDKRPALGLDGDTPSSSDVVAACHHLLLGSTL